MKKLILFLLLPLWAMAQTTTGQEQEFDYGIKNNSTQTITTPPYLTTTGMDGTQGKIPSALIEKTDNKQNSLAVDGTGVKYPTVDAINTGLALKALDSNVVHKTGNETVAGVKTFSSNIKLQTGILELNNSDDNGYGSILLNYNRFLFKDKTDKLQFLIEEGNFSTYKTSFIFGRFINSNLTAIRNYALPDASGTIALVETVKPYKVYTALLSQSGTSAPTATVLENTLGGTVVWTRSYQGSYVATLSSAFVLNKTAFISTPSNSSTIIAGGYATTSTVAVSTSDGGVSSDGLVSGAFIEIRVYN